MFPGIKVFFIYPNYRNSGSQDRITGLLFAIGFNFFVTLTILIIFLAVDLTPNFPGYETPSPHGETWGPTRPGAQTRPPGPQGGHTAQWAGRPGGPCLPVRQSEAPHGPAARLARAPTAPRATPAEDGEACGAPGGSHGGAHEGQPWVPHGSGWPSSWPEHRQYRLQRGARLHGRERPRGQ